MAAGGARPDPLAGSDAAGPARRAIGANGTARRRFRAARLGRLERPDRDRAAGTARRPGVGLCAGAAAGLPGAGLARSAAELSRPGRTQPLAAKLPLRDDLRPAPPGPSSGRARAGNADRGRRLLRGREHLPEVAGRVRAVRTDAAGRCGRGRVGPVQSGRRGQEDRTRLLPRLPVVSAAEPPPRRRAEEGRDGRRLGNQPAGSCAD